MRFDWRHYDTGWGELLCFVLAWTLGLGAVWLDYSGRPPSSAAKVAVSGSRAPSNANLD
jgi:hypothetical protein